ncbi:NAD-dependent epimerase/dehydratase family protein [archaeon]|nr:NAD-dependent epimerase/dehydratase family protein [archaeon]
MKIVVTGSTGLVGKELVKKLEEKRFQVFEGNHDNCDVLNKRQLENAFKGADIVVHLAAKLDEHALDMFDVNVKGTENVLDAASKAGVKQFIFLSSIALFGETPGLKNEESPVNPGTRYEKSKAEAEAKVLSYQEELPVTILRPAIIVGDNSYWKKIIGIIKKGFPLIGDGKNKWQLVCVSDVVDSILFSMNNENCIGETFIVAEKTPMSLRELAIFIREESGIKKPIKQIPLWLGQLVAFFNGFLKIVPLLEPAYLKRMNRDRHYSIKKFEKIGWKPKSSGKDCLRILIKKYS